MRVSTRKKRGEGVGGGEGGGGAALHLDNTGIKFEEYWWKKKKKTKQILTEIEK